MSNDGLRFPSAIDNSMRKELVKCQKIAHWKFEQGLNAEEKSADLVAGGAFARGCEVTRRAFYESGYPAENALSAGVQALYAEYGDFKCPAPKKYKTAKTADRMAGALAFYFGENPLDQVEFKPFLLEGKLSVEMSFNFPIPISHPVTHEQLTYCGRFDMLGMNDAGEVWVVDEKTTGEMSEAWVNQWLLDSALTGYCWGARKLLDSAGFDNPVVGAVINGVAIRAMSNEMPYEHMKVACYRPQWQIDRWYGQMLKDLREWKEAYLYQNHNQVLDHACALYNNPCQYAKLCNSANPERLMGSYVVRFWNPLERDVK